MERTRALLRCLRVLNALQGRLETTGAETAALSELGLPTEITLDPFTGQPLQVKKTDRGWLIYSVGRDLKDDGGSLDDWKDYGVGPER